MKKEKQFYIYKKNGEKLFPPWPYPSHDRANEVLSRLIEDNEKKHKDCYVK